MKLQSIFLACLLVITTSALELGPKSHLGALGVVDSTSCGGEGAYVQMRCAGCEGASCEIPAGQNWDCELDFTAANDAATVKLEVHVCISEAFCDTAQDVDLKDSVIQPGHTYSVRYGVVPRASLAGQTVTIRTRVSHGETVEICASVETKIL